MLVHRDGLRAATIRHVLSLTVRREFHSIPPATPSPVLAGAERSSGGRARYHAGPGWSPRIREALATSWPPLPPRPVSRRSKEADEGAGAKERKEDFAARRARAGQRVLDKLSGISQHRPTPHSPIARSTTPSLPHRDHIDDSLPSSDPPHTAPNLPPETSSPDADVAAAEAEEVLGRLLDLLDEQATQNPVATSHPVAASGPTDRAQTQPVAEETRVEDVEAETEGIEAGPIRPEHELKMDQDDQNTPATSSSDMAVAQSGDGEEAAQGHAVPPASHVEVAETIRPHDDASTSHELGQVTDRADSTFDAVEMDHSALVEPDVPVQSSVISSSPQPPSGRATDVLQDEPPSHPSATPAAVRHTDTSVPHVDDHAIPSVVETPTPTPGHPQAVTHHDTSDRVSASVVPLSSLPQPDLVSRSESSSVPHLHARYRTLCATIQSLPHNKEASGPSGASQQDRQYLQQWTELLEAAEGLAKLNSFAPQSLPDLTPLLRRVITPRSLSTSRQRVAPPSSRGASFDPLTLPDLLNALRRLRAPVSPTQLALLIRHTDPRPLAWPSLAPPEKGLQRNKGLSARERLQEERRRLGGKMGLAGQAEGLGVEAVWEGWAKRRRLAERALQLLERAERKDGMTVMAEGEEDLRVALGELAIQSLEEWRELEALHVPSLGFGEGGRQRQSELAERMRVDVAWWTGLLSRVISRLAPVDRLDTQGVSLLIRTAIVPPHIRPTEVSLSPLIDLFLHPSLVSGPQQLSFLLLRLTRHIPLPTLYTLFAALASLPAKPVLDPQVFAVALMTRTSPFTLAHLLPPLLALPLPEKPVGLTRNQKRLLRHFARQGDLLHVQPGESQVADRGQHGDLMGLLESGLERWGVGLPDNVFVQIRELERRIAVAEEGADLEEMRRELRRLRVDVGGKYGVTEGKIPWRLSKVKSWRRGRDFD